MIKLNIIHKVVVVLSILVVCTPHYYAQTGAVTNPFQQAILVGSDVPVYSELNWGVFGDLTVDGSMRFQQPATNFDNCLEANNGGSGLYFLGRNFIFGQNTAGIEISGDGFFSFESVPSYQTFVTNTEGNTISNMQINNPQNVRFINNSNLFFSKSFKFYRGLAFLDEGSVHFLEEAVARCANPYKYFVTSALSSSMIKDMNGLFIFPVGKNENIFTPLHIDQESQTLEVRSMDTLPASLISYDRRHIRPDEGIENVWEVSRTTNNSNVRSITAISVESNFGENFTPSSAYISFFDGTIPNISGGAESISEWDYVDVANVDLTPTIVSYDNFLPSEVPINDVVSYTRDVNVENLFSFDNNSKGYITLVRNNNSPLRGDFFGASILANQSECILGIEWGFTDSYRGQRFRAFLTTDTFSVTPIELFEVTGQGADNALYSEVINVSTSITASQVFVKIQEYDDFQTSRGYSPIETPFLPINLTCTNDEFVDKIYPSNVSGPSAFLQVNVNVADEVYLRIINLEGEVVVNYPSPYRLSPGINTIRVNIPNTLLNDQIYFLQVYGAVLNPSLYKRTFQFYLRR